MTDSLGDALVALAILTIVLMVGLFVTKSFRHYQRRRAAFRSAIYISALGEIVSRSMIPDHDVSAWAKDPAFHDTLVDYFGFVDGEGRDLLVDLAHSLGLVEGFHRKLTKSPRTSVRLRAVSALAVIASPESRSDLIAALEDRATEVRIGAAAGLSMIGRREDVRVVLGALEREERWAAERMADALVRFGEVAVQEISNYILLAGPSLVPAPNHLAIAVRTLGLIGDRGGETALLTALSGADPLLRIKAAAALTQPWDGRATRALLRRLSDDDWRVRAQAAKALATHNDSATLPALTLALRDRAWWVRQNAAETLAEIEGGIETLFEVLDDEDRFAVDAALAQLMAHGEIDTTDPDRLALLAALDRPHLLERNAG